MLFYLKAVFPDLYFFLRFIRILIVSRNKDLFLFQEEIRQSIQAYFQLRNMR